MDKKVDTKDKKMDSSKDKKADSSKDKKGSTAKAKKKAKMDFSEIDLLLII